MNRVVNRPVPLVHSQWFQGTGSFILDQRNSLSQSALSWHVPVKTQMSRKMSIPSSISLQLMFLCDIEHSVVFIMKYEK